MTAADSNVSTVRHENMALLLNRFGSPNKLALAVKRSYAVARRWKDKPVTDEEAGRIEHCLNLPRGWLSVPHPEGVAGAGRVDELAGIAEDNSDAMQEVRRANVGLLIGDGHGGKAQFAKALRWHASEVVQLHTRTFGHRKARALETNLGLPERWLDVAHTAEEVPSAVREFISGSSGNAPADARVVSVSRAPLTLPGAGGPVARALLQTIVDQIDQGVLSEKKAHELLGKLLETMD